MRWIFVFFLSFSFSGAQGAGSVKNSNAPQISVKFTFSGDLTDVYQFGGLVGQSLKGEVDKPGACESSATFREVLYRQKPALEVWLILKCKVADQIQEFRPARFFVDLNKPEQKLSFPAQSEKIKNVELVVSEIEIKRPKKKK